MLPAVVARVAIELIMEAQKITLTQGSTYTISVGTGGASQQGAGGKGGN